MQKLKLKNFNNLINYNFFLKNNFLKKNQLKLKNIIFEKYVLLNHNNLLLIELNNYKNLFLLNISNINLKFLIYTIKSKYNDNLLLTYDFLNYFFLQYYNFLLFKKIKKKYKNKIKGRIIKSHKYFVLVFNLGIIYNMKPSGVRLNKKYYGNKKYYRNKKHFYKNLFKNRRKLTTGLLLKKMLFKIIKQNRI